MAITTHLRLTGIALLGITLLTGCKSTPKPAECDETQGAYLTAQDHGLLKIPEGDATPDRRNMLTVPPASGKAVDTRVCLQKSPSYFGVAGRIAASPEEIVADWAQAWADRNTEAVMSMYSTKFVTDAPDGSTAWLEQRRTDINAGALPNPRVSALKITPAGDDVRLATFTQTFGTSTVRKELRLIRDAGLWKISRESVLVAQ